MRLSMSTMTRVTIPAVLFAFVTVVGFAQEIQPGTLFHPRRLIVKFKAASESLVRERSANAQLRVARLERLNPIKPDGGSTPLPGGVERIFVAQVADGADPESVFRELSANPEIEYAEHDFVGHGDGTPGLRNPSSNRVTLAPDDPLFGLQWGMENRGQIIGGFAGKPGVDINARAAWRITSGDSSTLLAVLDTGIALNAADFEGRLVPGYNFVSNSNNPADDYGHGTNVASIAAATGANGLAVAGVNWRCRILPLKILDNRNLGLYSWWASALIYAADHGANVINISAGGSSPSSALEDAVTYASSRGAIIVASMMNTNSETPFYPAAYSNVIAVGGINNRGERGVPFCYSSTTGSNYGSHIAVVAPGEMILGLDFQDPSHASFWCGTSQATPLVSGIVSLMLALNPTLTFRQAYDALKAGALDQVGPSNEDTPGWDKYFGWGRVDAYRSLLALSGNRIFAHVAIGGGYSTTFALLNTGSTSVSGNLILTDKSGAPMDANLAGPSVNPALSGSGARSTASSLTINLPPGGVLYVEATPPNPGAETITGWARVETSGGLLDGVATFRSTTAPGSVQTIAGVLASNAVTAATIPVDDDLSQDRYTGYAVANPGTESITIKAVMVNPDGTQGTTLSPINLGPGQQVAAFLYQDPKASPKLQGSVVLIGQGGAYFSAVALVQNHGLYTAIPVIPSKPSGIN